MKRKIRGEGSRKKRSPKPPPIDPELEPLPPWEWIPKYCRIPEGPDVGKPVALRIWQKEILYDIYRNPHGTRRAILSFGRKNAKTSLAAFILLYHLCGDGLVPNSHIYSAAQSRDQAGILFELAAKIVRLNPILARHVTVKDAAKELHFHTAGTRYKALSAEVSTAYGLSPVLVIHDELGQVRGPRSELYDALETATSAHANPMSIIISTQAPGDNDLLSMLIDDALAKNDPRTIIRLFTAPPDLDPFSDATIKLANPAFGDFQNADEVRAMAANAKRMPAIENGYRNLILNQRVASSARFISPDQWKACAAKPSPFAGKKIYAGLDLSAVADLTACVLMHQEDGIWHVHPTFWLPEDGVQERAQLDRAPYDVWSRQGYITLVPGKSVDYEYVARWLRELFDICEVQKIGFDRWNFSNLKAWLLRSEFDEEKIAEHFVEFGQGFQSMSPALHAFETEIINARLAHGGNPVLTMCADNAVVVTDPQNNRKLSKQKSVRRIDGLVALTMAFGIANLQNTKEPEYEMIVL